MKNLVLTVREPLRYAKQTSSRARFNWIRSNMFLRKNSMITRNGDSRQAERTREYVSIGENRMSVRANFNKKHYDIKITLCFCRVFFYVVHPTSNVLSKCYHNRQLPNGTLAAHTNTYLSLLPPGPDEVRKIYVAQEPFVQHLLLWASLTGDALWSGIHSIYSGFMVTGCRYLPN